MGDLNGQDDNSGERQEKEKSFDEIPRTKPEGAAGLSRDRDDSGMLVSRGGGTGGTSRRARGSLSTRSLGILSKRGHGIHLVDMVEDYGCYEAERRTSNS
jgi:hypothetical protein